MTTLGVSDRAFSPADARSLSGLCRRALFHCRRDTEVVFRVGEIRLEPQRLLIVVDGFLQPPDLGKRGSEIVVGEKLVVIENEPTANGWELRNCDGDDDQRCTRKHGLPLRRWRRGLRARRSCVPPASPIALRAK